MTPAENRHRLAVLRAAPPDPVRTYIKASQVDEVVSAGGKRNRASSLRRLDVIGGARLG